MSWKIKITPGPNGKRHLYVHADPNLFPHSEDGNPWEDRMIVINGKVGRFTVTATVLGTHTRSGEGNIILFSGTGKHRIPPPITVGTTYRLIANSFLEGPNAHPKNLVITGKIE